MGKPAPVDVKLVGQWKWNLLWMPLGQRSFLACARAGCWNLHAWVQFLLIHWATGNVACGDSDCQSLLRPLVPTV
jgi:hypothetical protein